MFEAGVSFVVDIVVMSVIAMAVVVADVVEDSADIGWIRMI